MQMQIEARGDWRASLCYCCVCQNHFTVFRQKGTKLVDIRCPECRRAGNMIDMEPPWIGTMMLEVSR